MGTIELELSEVEKDLIMGGRGFILKETPYGRAGDTFAISGRRFEIIDVCERSLGRISRQYPQISECDYLSGYIKGWEARHRRECEPGTSLFIHWFRQI
jgi:hypothetical protein